MSAITSPQPGRNAGFAVRSLLFGAIGAAGIWYLGWSPNAVIDHLSGFLRSWLAVAIVIFVAASISSTVGFAFSAIAAAMIFHLVPDNIQAVQIMMVASIGIQAYSVAGMYQTISWRACTPFLIGGAATIPLGIYLLLNILAQTYIVAMGLALISYGTFMLSRRPYRIEKGGTFVNIAVGALGGLTGPLAAFPGASVTIWCGMRGWSKVVQRSIYQPYILIIQILTLGGLSILSQRTALNGELLSYALPATAGAYLGLRIFHRLTDMQFQRLVNLALIASGTALLFK